MALIHVYETLAEHWTIEADGKLHAVLPALDLTKYIALVGGKRVDADYETKPDDIVFVRRVPGEPVSFLLTLGPALIMSAIGLGIELYQQKKKLAELNDSANAARTAGASSTQKLPYVKGARNTAATGNTFPYIIGETLMTPYTLCTPHYTIAGDKGQSQYVDMALLVGFNNLCIRSIKLGNTTIKTLDGNTPQDGVYSWDNGIYYDSRNIIEIRQTGEFTTAGMGDKIILTDLNKEIPHRHLPDNATAQEREEIEDEWKAGVLQTLPENAKSVEVIALFDGLRKYDDGAWKSQSVTLKPQWTNVENPQESDWHDFTNGFNQNGTYSNTFSYNSSAQMRFAARQDFTAAQGYGKKMSVRVVRTTPKAESNARDTVYLMAVQTTCYDPKQSTASNLVTAKILDATARGKCCRIGIRIAANENTKDNLDAISVIAAGTARTWNGTEWSENKTTTRNLAAWLLEILTSAHHAPSRYDDTELDLPTFGALYEYCAAQGFNADGVIQKGRPKKQTVETLCRNANCSLVYSPASGKIEVAIDNGRDYSLALLNSENIIAISTARELKRRADGMKMKYVNRAAEYDADSVIFMRDGGEYDPTTDTLTEATAEYLTDYAHAYKYVWRRMAEEQAQPKTVQVRVGYEGAYYPLYGRVDVQHVTLTKGLAHSIIKETVWQYGRLQKIKVDGYVDFPAGAECGVIVNCVSDTGHGVLALKVSGTGRTDTLTLVSEVTQSDDLIPEEGNFLSFGTLDSDGEFSQIRSTMKITDIEENDNGYTLTLVDYNPAVYEYGTLPTYKTNLTAIPDSRRQTVEEQREYVQLPDAQALTADSVQAAVDTVTHGQRFTNIYKVRPVETTLDEIIAKIDDDARNQTASISISEEEILLQVENVEKGLVGLIDIQAGAVTALVEGGGASGQMSLTLNLPVLIDATTRAKLIQASTEAKVAAVYALLDGTSGAGARYAIKGNATDADVKALWDDAVDGGLLASQIELEADQIFIDGDVIVNDENKIKAAMIDVQNLLASDITVKDKGVIHSDNYDGTIDANGNITTYGSAGWAIDHAGKADFGGGHFNGTIKMDGGFLQSNKTPFQPMAMVNIGYDDTAIVLSNSKNVSSIQRGGIGEYSIFFENPVKLKTHVYNGKLYVDVFVISNASQSFTYGFLNPLEVNINWLRQYVDGRVPVDSSGYAYVNYVILYFINHDSADLQDPVAAQCFIFGTETD